MLKIFFDFVPNLTPHHVLQAVLVDVDVGLVEAGYLLACLAIPWAWFIGLIIPIPGSSQDQLNVNLKLAKQNKNRNIVKYQ